MPPFQEYTEAISGLWDSRWLTNAGSLHRELAEKLKEKLEAPNLALFSNGHMALELGLQALELKGEVITTPFTFASTTQAIVRNGLTPVFCDIDPVRLTIDTKKIERLITPYTSAIVAVHVYGIPCDVEAISMIAKKYGLKVIYDAAHAFGVRYLGKGISSYGDYTMFSFHATKVFHTVEGGGGVFDSSILHDKLLHLRDFGLNDGNADFVGTNAKLSEFHAAMGLCNLHHVDEEIKKREKIVQKYNERLVNVEGIQLFPQIDRLQRNFSYYPIIFHDKFGKNRDQVLEELKKREIYARKYFYPLTSNFHCFSGRFAQEKTPIAENISNRILCLPLYADLTEAEVNKICDTLLHKI